MKDRDFNKLVDFYNAGGGLLPVNQRAHELIEQTGKDEVLSFIEVTQRDLKFHRCYMSLLAYIYGYLPQSFQRKVAKDKFYIWLKHLKGQYDILFEFEDGTKLVEYESISFGRMSQIRFEEYIREQLPWIYTDVIGKFFEGDIYNGIIDTIEEDYKKFLSKL
jgi:hypothetical protein